MDGMGFNSSESSDNTSAEDALTERREDAEISITALFLVFIIGLAVTGNIMVIRAIQLCPMLRDDRSNLFIINLAITDLSSAIIVMSSSFVSLVADKWPFPQIVCDFVCAANYCFIIVSMLTLSFISIDRYQAVINPLLYIQRMTRPKIFAMISYSWLQGVAFACIPVAFRWVSYDYWEVICAIEWHTDPQALYYVILAFLMCFLIPGIILAVCYFCVLREARHCRIGCVKMNTSNSRLENGGQRTKNVNSNSKTIRSLIFVVLAYFICLTPFCVTKLIKVISAQPNFLPGYINLLSSWFGYLSSAINPLIYGIFRRDFRRVYLRIIHKLPFFSSSPRGDDTANSTFGTEAQRTS
ncbi:5-hydroxytryptamine receptor 1A-like [Liolophura sinensis]|uniref:5-hydroxytryptamine receptor 1A-like n=1 Tax=Liolophura sinensis TaxID=3198878 RepID=UPI0031588F0D